MEPSAAARTRHLGIEIQVVPSVGDVSSHLCVTMLTFATAEHVSEVKSGELLEADLEECQPLRGESDLGYAMRVTRKALRAMEEHYYALTDQSGGLKKAFEWLEG
jgi:hypothetical protein